MSSTGAMITATFGWWKWVFAFVTGVTFLVTLIGAIGNRKQLAEIKAKTTPNKRPEGLGICLSGGGIRSASFALGGLQALDEAKQMVKAKWITAVSGGAYTAGAWRIARGTKEDNDVEPKCSATRDHLLDEDPPGSETPNRFRYIRHFRRFLANGRGGLSSAVVVGVGFVVFNLAVLLVMLYLIAYPIGWLTSTWAIQPGLGRLGYADVFDQEIATRSHLWLPGALGIVAGAATWLASMVFWGCSQQRFSRAAVVLLGTGTTLLGLLVGLPWLMVNGAKLMAVIGQQFADQDESSTGAGLIGILSAVGVTGALVRIATQPLAKNAARLGGALLAALALVFGGKVATDAAFDRDCPRFG